MGYMGDGLPNWHFDRQRRTKLFDLIKKRTPVLKPDASAKREFVHSDPKKRKYTWVLPLIGAIVKVGLFIFIFYAFAMILSHGKYWPE